MSATGARETVQGEAEFGTEEQLGEALQVAEAATAVEIEREEIVESPPGETVELPVEAPEAGALTPALSQEEKEKEAEKVRAAEGLPPALKECLARVTLAHAEAGADGTVRVPIEAAVRAIEEALPEFLRRRSAPAERPEHPAGEVFFHGDPAELSDAEAEEIARGQLARSGLLRGQRARE